MIELCVIFAVVTVGGLCLMGLVSLMHWLNGGGAVSEPLTQWQVPARCRRCGRIRAADSCRHCRMTLTAIDNWADWKATTQHLIEYRDAHLIDEATFLSLRRHALTRSAEFVPAPVHAPAPTPSEAILEALPVDPVALAPRVEEEMPAPTPVLANAPDEPRRGWLAAFMEERHILWGELVGGLLVVGCSVALVLSLWQTLQHIVMFPFLILAALTSALFAVGRHTLRKWELESTSRGLLVIALLMVPLNFLVLAKLASESQGAPIEWFIKCTAVPWFAWLVYRTGRDLFRDQSPGLLTLGVVGTSIGAFMLPMLVIGTGHSAIILALPLLPVLGHAAAIGFNLRRRSTTELQTQSAFRLLGFAGLVTFPLPLALGFTLLARSAQGGDVIHLLTRLGPVIALAAVSVSAAGLYVTRRSRADARWAMIAGTGVAFLGLFAQVLALVFTWPYAVGVVLIGALIYVFWTMAAVGFRLPLAHAWALPGLAVALVAGYQFVDAESIAMSLQWRALISGDGGRVLAGLSLIWLVAADRMRAANAWSHGAMYAGGGAVAMTLALLLVGREASSFPARPAIVGAIAATACFILASRWHYAPLRQVGFALIPVTSLAALHWRVPGDTDLWEVVLATELLAFSLSAAVWAGPIILAAILTATCVMASASVPALAHPLAATLIAAAAIIQAQRRRVPGLALAGSALVLAAAGHLWLLRPASPMALAIPLTFLTHAVLMLPALAAKQRTSLAPVGSLLDLSGRTTSLLAALGLVFFLHPPHWASVALIGAGLTALWLLFALAERKSVWLSAAQAASFVAGLTGVIAALGSVSSLFFALQHHFEPIALALTGIASVWAIVRFVPWMHSWTRSFEIPVDRLVLGTVLLPTILLVSARTLPGVLSDFGSSGILTGFEQQISHRVFSLPMESLLLVTLAAALGISFETLRHAVARAVVVAGLMLLAMTVPAIVAREFAAEHAAASALRWGLGIVYLLGSLMFWLRGRTSKEWQRLGLVSVLRDIVLAIAAILPLFLTLVTMAQLIGGEAIVLPGDATIFRRVGFTGSHAVPLLLVLTGFVGHAIRERYSAYAFLGGLLAAFLSCGGFLVSVATAQRPFNQIVLIELVQRFAITAGAWAAGWLAISNALGRLRPAGRQWWRTPSPLWHAQAGLSIVAILLLAIPAVITIAIGEHPAWIAAVAALPAWVALALLVATSVLWSRLTDARIGAHIGGVGALMAVALAASLVPAEHAGWSLRVILIGWVATGVAMLTRGDHQEQWFGSVGTLLGTLAVLTGASRLSGYPELALVLAAYPLAAALTIRYRGGVLPSSGVTAVLGILVLVLGTHVVLRAEELDVRLLAPLAVLSLTCAAMLARRLQIALVLAVYAALTLVWAAGGQPESAAWLHRSCMAFCVLVAASIVYGFSPWSRFDTVRETGLMLGRLAVGLLIGLLLLEGLQFDPLTKHTPLSAVETAFGTAGIIGLLSATLAVAIQPRGYSFGVSWTGRRAAVYLAEGMLVGLFLHLRFNVPGLFPKIEAQTWAFLIMAIAFAGVGLGELFRRLRLEILVAPLRRTGLFLPLLPLLMFWMKPTPPMRATLVDIIPGSQPLLAFFDQIPTDYGNYAALWVLFGVLFGWLAIIERSYWFALVSALAANAGLWSLLHGQGVSFLVHPQLWLVPLALITLASEWYHRPRLKAEESAALRYLGLGMLYLSSTADMFLAGLGESALLPLVLAVLSVTGVLLGMMLRVRAYLFLGTGFLGVVVLSMIWHAAVDLSQTWIWWTCGVALGAAILTLFGLFEKRRLNLVKIVDELRTWR